MIDSTERISSFRSAGLSWPASPGPGEIRRRKANRAIRERVKRMSDSLFPDVEAREAGDGRDEAPARYETANRTQI
jgi:hypothetical protein